MKKKLSLNKSTIANLNSDELNQVIGGDNSEPCPTHDIFCNTDTGTSEGVICQKTTTVATVFPNCVTQKICTIPCGKPTYGC